MSLQLASLFQNNAVLQRDQLLPVWGWTAPSVMVRVTLGSHTVSALSNAHGDFAVRLPAMPAGGPHTLKVTVAETSEAWEARDILIGEVWLASGQSNMEWTLSSSLPLTAEAISSADLPDIRFFTLPPRAILGAQRTTEGEWKTSTPETAGKFSAVAFSFARRLHQELGVPIGVISSSWGGSIIESWTSRPTLALNPEMQEWLAQYESKVWTESHWKTMLSPDSDGRVSAIPKDPGNLGLDQGWHLPDFPDSAWDTMELPGLWQFAGHPYSGVFWFRRQIEIPASWIGRELTLNLGAIDKQDITYVNGMEVGRTGKDREDGHWSQPRTYTVPASAVAGTQLVIAVRVYSFVYDGGMTGPAAVMKLHPGGDAASALPLDGNWNYFCERNFGKITETHIMGHGERNSPHILFDNMIQPLIPYALRGAIWYQGEGNAGAFQLYTRLMQDLIQDWRRQWGQSDFAFHLVQLPNFQSPKAHQPDSRWAGLREAQTAALSLPNVGMAVVIDLGDAADIHPLNKIPVGERLAQSALALNYGRDLVPGGPIATDFTAENGAIRCQFRNTGKGLICLNGTPLRTFFIAGNDQVFFPAEARIENQSVIVSHPEVHEPAAVRYAWADNPEDCNLANSEGLPASPFRSDRW